MRTLDVSDYEAARLCTTCIEQNPGTAMQNTFRMLRPGGRVFLMEIGTPHHNAYTMYSPAFFFDYFAINNFAGCKVYVCMFAAEAVHTGPFDFYTWRGFDHTLWQYPMDAFPPNTALISLVIGEKGPQSTWNKKPVQGQYRADHAPYRAAYQSFERSPRPRLKIPQRPSVVTNHPAIEYVGSW